MGRDVENYIVVKSKEIDLVEMYKNYIDSILENEDLMIYSTNLFEDSSIEFVRENQKLYKDDLAYVVNEDYIIFALDTRKCDLEESFSEFIKENKDKCSIARLYMYNGESGSELNKYDFILNKYKSYYDNIPNWFSSSCDCVIRFIMLECFGKDISTEKDDELLIPESNTIGDISDSDCFLRMPKERGKSGRCQSSEVPYGTMDFDLLEKIQDESKDFHRPSSSKVKSLIETIKPVIEEKDPNDMFKDPIHEGQCPLCGGDVYVENDPSDDTTMSSRCSRCTWNTNQFLSWEEMNNL